VPEASFSPVACGCALAASRLSEVCQRTPRTNNWKLTPWTGGAGPIDPATAWPCDRVQVLQWVPAEYLRPVSRPGSGWIDRTSAPRPGDWFLLTIPECMHIDSRWYGAAIRGACSRASSAAAAQAAEPWQQQRSSHARTAAGHTCFARAILARDPYTFSSES
jgi:hypothetical protein